MPAILSLHKNEVLAHLFHGYFHDHSPFSHVFMPSALRDNFALTLQTNLPNKTAQNCRVIIVDQELWQSRPHFVNDALSHCSLKPFLLSLGEIDTPHAHITIPRPFRLGHFMDTLDALLSTTVENIPVTDIACQPFGHIHVPSKTWHATDAATPLTLTDKEIMLLYILSCAQSGPVNKAALYRAVWGFDEELETHTLETHIYRLRQKIEPDPNNPCIIKTFDTGYTLVNYEN